MLIHWLGKIQLSACLLALFMVPNPSWSLTNTQIAELSLQVFSVQGEQKARIVEALIANEDKSLIPTLVLAMRWTGSNVHVARALTKLTGENITTWHEAYHWQQRHPEVKPHATYRDLKLRFLSNTDARFMKFFNTPDGEQQPTRIRLEEIVWGGALYEGIPSLESANMIPAAEAEYLHNNDLVFGVEINGDARAYPLRILGWHEMLNDEIGGVPVTLAYCTLCGSGILYDTRNDNQSEPFSFGSSGLLYRSNKLMFDRQTHSLWNQFTGEPVSGALLDSGITLSTHPLTITSWELWMEQHKDTKVLSLETGYVRNYNSGITYAEYFASPELMFPAFVEEKAELSLKDYVFGVRQFAASKAWPLHAFEDEPVINDRVGANPLVLIGNASTRTARAYERRSGEHFELTPEGKLSLNGALWTIEEEFLRGPSEADRRARLPGHVSYWFAWENFMGENSTLYKPKSP